MTKLKKLDPKPIRREDFANQTSYKAALWCVDVLNNIITRCNAGDILLSYENLIKPDFELDVCDDGSFSGICVRVDTHTRVLIVGDEHQEVNGEFKIWVTKRSLREYFKLWRLVKVTNTKHVYDFAK